MVDESLTVSGIWKPACCMPLLNAPVCCVALQMLSCDDCVTVWGCAQGREDEYEHVRRSSTIGSPRLPK